MKTEAELEKDIMGILKKIRNDFPELTKFIDEMPLSNKGDSKPDIATIELEAYFNSLNNLYNEYSSTHSIKTGK
jgi:hypothetical protein